MSSEADIKRIALHQMQNNFTGEVSDSLLDTLYRPVLRTVLESNLWTFNTTAKKLVSSPESAEKILELYNFFNGVFYIPQDCLRIYNVRYQNLRGTTRYHIITDREPPHLRLLLTYGEELVLEYATSQVNAVAFSSSFVFAVAYKLAYEVAVSLTGDSSIIGRLRTDYMERLKEAKGMDAQQKQPLRVSENPFASAAANRGGIGSFTWL